MTPPEQHIFRRQKKKKKFESLFRGDHVLVHLDSRREGVAVPEHLREDSNLTLKLSCLFQGETTYDDESIVSFLKFGGHYFRCVLPWDAIWGMTDEHQRSVMWTEDMPRDLMMTLAKAQLQDLGERFLKRRRSKSSEQSDSEEQDQGETPEDPTPAERRRSILKRIK